VSARKQTRRTIPYDDDTLAAIEAAKQAERDSVARPQVVIEEPDH
jgi:hypothetical protein